MATSERATFWRDSALPGVDLLDATYTTHRYLPHQHDGYAIGVIESGAEGFRYRGAQHVAPAGSAVVINPGETHTGHAANERGWHYRMLYLDPAWLVGSAAELGGQNLPFFPSGVVQDPLLADLLRTAFLAAAERVGTLEREIRLRTALTHLVRRHADASHANNVKTDHAALRRARDLLREELGTALSLSDLAARVGLSPFHLARQFHAAYGLPPHAYRLSAQVEAARRSLVAGTPAARAALEAGFADQAHFTRTFKRMYGVPPGQYRRGMG